MILIISALPRDSPARLLLGNLNCSGGNTERESFSSTRYLHRHQFPRAVLLTKLFIEIPSVFRAALPSLSHYFAGEFSRKNCSPS